jgi:hypothetical protein
MCIFSLIKYLHMRLKAVSVYVPEVQGKHEICFSLGWNLPKEHEIQDVALSEMEFAYDPAKQSVHTEEPTELAILPVKHDRQDV